MRISCYVRKPLLKSGEGAVRVADFQCFPTSAVGKIRIRS